MLSHPFLVRLCQINRDANWKLIFTFINQTPNESITRKACFKPPLSAIFSDCVSFPFMYMPSSLTLYREYWSIIHWARSRNASIVALFHHCFMLPNLNRNGFYCPIERISSYLWIEKILLPSRSNWRPSWKYGERRFHIGFTVLWRKSIIPHQKIC